MILLLDGAQLVLSSFSLAVQSMGSPQSSVQLLHPALRQSCSPSLMGPKKCTVGVISLSASPSALTMTRRSGATTPRLSASLPRRLPSLSPAYATLTYISTGYGKRYRRAGFVLNGSLRLTCPLMALPRPPTSKARGLRPPARAIYDYGSLIYRRHSLKGVCQRGIP
jgi:hypothetical protein